MDEIKQLKNRIAELERYVGDRKRQQITFPLDAVSLKVLQQTGGALLIVPNGGTGASSLTGIIKGNGTGAFTAIVPLSGTKIYYVSDSSGGAVTRKLTFTNGILTAET